MLCEVKHSYRVNTSEETTIELLCDNVLLEVFSYLKAQELKNASLVCKRWNEIIGSSAVTMKKFKFEIKDEMLQFHVKNFGSSRNHQHYFIQLEDSIDWTVVAQNMEITHVKSFDIKRSRFCELISDDVINFLSKLTELETLNFSGVRLTVTEESTQAVKMSKLKSAIICGDYTILEYIDAEKLQDLQYTACSSSLIDYEPFANSLVRFSNLKRLTLRGCMEMFEHININMTKFKLNFIEVYHINANPVNVNVFADNLQKFLMVQADSLQELRFDFSMYDIADGQRIVNDFLQVAFNKCINLLYLDIRNLSISRDGNFYQSLSPNSSIKSLKVHWNFEGEVIKGLLQNSPKLEKLRTEYCYLRNDGINSIAKLCRKLIHLDTYKLMGIAADDVVFEKLKFLDIFIVEKSFDPLISLVTKSPVIQQIRIHECKNVETFPLDLIIQQPSMRKLIIQEKCYEIVTDENKLRIIKMTHLEQK